MVSRPRVYNPVVRDCRFLLSGEVGFSGASYVCFARVGPYRTGALGIRRLAGAPGVVADVVRDGAGGGGVGVRVVGLVDVQKLALATKLAVGRLVVGGATRNGRRVVREPAAGAPSAAGALVVVALEREQLARCLLGEVGLGAGVERRGVVAG